MSKKYVILDPKGRFFVGFSSHIPEVIYDFTDDELFAWKTEDLEQAKKVIEVAYTRIYQFNGNDRLPEGYLKIARIDYKVI